MKHAVLPFFPPTSNNAFFTKGGIRVLKKEGTRFKNEVKHHLLKEYPDVLAYFKKDVEYEILLVFYFEVLYNNSWPKDPKVARHKKQDASNRIKLTEDAIKEAAGYDDSQHWVLTSAKLETLNGEKEHVELWVWNEHEYGPIGRFLFPVPGGAPVSSESNRALSDVSSSGVARTPWLAQGGLHQPSAGTRPPDPRTPGRRPARGAHPIHQRVLEEHAGAAKVPRKKSAPRGSPKG